MASSGTQTRWLPLSEACALIKVHQSTLRQWADSGHIRTFRTAGGHRRFLLDDLTAMLEGREPTQPAATSVEEHALRAIRRKLHGEHTAHEQPWMDALSSEGKVKMRLFGRRLLDLSVVYLSQKRQRPEVISEVQTLAAEYGQDLAHAGVPLDSMMEAFVFFRNSLFDAVRDAAQHGSLRGTDIALVWQHMEEVADQMLLSMIRAYERSLHAPVSGYKVAAQAGNEN